MIARLARRVDPRRHFCFACDRWTWREHRAHQAIVAKLPAEWTDRLHGRGLR